MTGRIPNRIIQTGKSRKLSLLEQAAVANLTALNPGFEYIFFDDQDVEGFIDDEFPEYRSIYDGFPHRIQRFDFFRYLAVYRLGGFYFDLDVLLAKGVGELRNVSCVFSFEELSINTYLRAQYNIDWEIGNYAFGAASGHPFLRAVIDNCVRSQTDPAWVARILAGIPSVFRSGFDVLYTTGPGLLTRTLAENSELSASVHILFPHDVCDARNWHNFGEYGVHLMAASWRPRGSYLRRRLALLWENSVRRRLQHASSKRGKSRSHAHAASALT